MVGEGVGVEYWWCRFGFFVGFGLLVNVGGGGIVGLFSSVCCCSWLNYVGGCWCCSWIVV